METLISRLYERAVGQNGVNQRSQEPNILFPSKNSGSEFANLTCVVTL